MIFGTLSVEFSISERTETFLRDLVHEIARAVAAGALDRTQSGIPARDTAPPTGMTTISTGSARRVGDADVADDTRSGRAASASPTQFPQGNARSAGDEPAILDVSSQQLAPATASPERSAGASFSKFGPRGGTFTVEQTELLRRLCAQRPRPSWKFISGEIGKLPGAQPTPGSTYQKARVIGVLHLAPEAEAAQPVAAPVAPPASKPAEFLERHAGDILQWCAFAKFKVGKLDDAALESINAFRARKGMAPFKLSPPVKIVAQQPHRASREAILRWANQRGLCMDGVLDLAVVNATAKRIGAVEFELEEPPARQRAVPSIIRHRQQGEPEHAP